MTTSHWLKVSRIFEQIHWIESLESSYRWRGFIPQKNGNAVTSLTKPKKSLNEVRLKHISVVVTYLMWIRIVLNSVCNSTSSVCGINKHHCQRSRQNGKCRMWKNVKSLWKSKWNVWHFPPHTVYTHESPTAVTLYFEVCEQYLDTTFFLNMNGT